MFTLNPKIERLDLKSSEIVAVVSSGNRPFVAVSGPAQEADAYIISAKEGKGRYVYVCLHMVMEDKRLFFTSDECPTTESKIHQVETDAVNFIEDMGFMIVKKNMLDERAGALRENFIRRLVPFAENLKDIRKREEREKEEKRTKIVKVEDEEEEYEEVLEEVYEEVPVEEEDDSDRIESSGGARGEEEVKYESLDDIMVDDSSDLEVKSSGVVRGIVDKPKREGVKAEIKIEADSKRIAEAEDKVSIVVESAVKNIPDISASKIRTDDDKVVRERVARKTESEFFVEEDQKDLVKLLISL